ncbi:MAG: hypothetical protein WBW56_14250, partial [Syntrophobacteraceae bacterium]
TNNLFTGEDFAKSFAKVNDVLDEMGLTGEQQIGLVAAAADIAAVRGLNLEDTVTGITKALGGAGKAGLQYGLSLKDNYMETVAFGGSLKDVWSSLSATDKEALRYREFLIQTAKYSGDAAIMSGTLSGQIKSITNALKEALTLGGPQSVLGDIGVPDIKIAENAGLVVNLQEKSVQEALALNSATAGYSTQLANALGNMNKLVTAAADYQGRTGAEQEADSQRQISVELAKQTSAQQQLKTLEADRVQQTKSLESLEQQLAYLVSTNTGDLYTDNFAQQQDIMGKISDAKLKISSDDAAILEQEQAINNSMQAQNQLAWNQESATAVAAQKMAYAAAYTGTTGEFNTPAYQKDITGLLNDQAAAQKKIIELEAQRSAIEQTMTQTIGQDPDAYNAQAQQLAKVNSQLDFEKAQVGYISDVFKGLEAVRLNALADSMDFSQAQKQAADLQITIDTLHQSKPSFDTSFMEVQLKNLNDQVVVFQNNINKALSSVGGKRTSEPSGMSSVLDDMFPPDPSGMSSVLGDSFPQTLPPDLGLEASYGNQAAKAFTDSWNATISDAQMPPVASWTQTLLTYLGILDTEAEAATTAIKGIPASEQTEFKFLGNVDGSDLPMDSAISKVQGDMGSLAQVIDQGATFIVNMQMAMSPAVSFSEGMANLQGYFARIPQNMNTVINMDIQGGDTLSQALQDWEAIVKYQPVISDMNAQMQVANASMSELLYAAATLLPAALVPTGVDFSVLAYQKATAQEYVQSQQQAYLEAEAGLQQATQGTPAAGTASGTGTTSSTNTGVELNFAVSMQVGAGGSPQDTAVAVATTLDGQLAGMILANRSQIVAALIKMGLVISS